MADATSNESGVIDFQPYLQSIGQHYQQWWTLYTLTDAEGREKLENQPATWDAPFDFGLMVQTVQKRSVPEAEDPDSDRSDSQEKIERLPVLEGIRKYASEHVLLVGRPGSGKSTVLARLLLEESSSAANSNKGRPGQIPVLVELRFWQTSIADLIRNFFARHGLSLDRSQIEHLLFYNRLLLLVDGLNELPSEAARQDVAKLRRDYPQVSAIFTTRDLNLGGDFGIEKKLEMQPLTTTQMQDFVRSHLEDKAESMLQGLGDRLREFGQTPLLLWMLCSLFKQTGQIPTNLGGVFREFTQSYERKVKHDIVPESDHRWWLELLQTLAFAMMHSQPLSTLEANRNHPTLDVELRVAIPETEVYQIFVECLKLREPQPEGAARKCLDDLLRHHLIQADGEQIEFRHQLIQEYYVAEYLLTRVEQMSDLGLQQQYLNYLKWTEPLALMLALVEGEGLAERVVELALNVDLMLGARLAGEVKLQFQKKMVGFVEALEVPDWLKFQLLKKTRSDSAIPAVLKLLEDSDLKVRWRAAEALGNLRSEAAIPSLLQLLGGSVPEVRRKAEEALSKIAEGKTDAITQHLPHLLTLISTASDEEAHWVILTIQETCKYYNYALTQTVDSIKLFFSYAHKDEALRDTLATHLALLKRQGIITTWHDRDITAGTEWAKAIDNNLNTADIILLLISADFIHPDYCYDTEMQWALERHENGEARVIPILLRPCDWEGAPFGKLQALPIAYGAGLKPVTQWSDQDEAFTAIAQGIRKAAEELKKARVG